MAVEWPGLPLGVKFEPTDVELLQHLAAKCGVGNEMPHQFIDEFIPTLDKDEGICYKHPENLPGEQSNCDAVFSVFIMGGIVGGSNGSKVKTCSGQWYFFCCRSGWVYLFKIFIDILCCKKVLFFICI